VIILQHAVRSAITATAEFDFVLSL